MEKLLAVQRQLQGLHEMRQAGFAAAASAAAEDIRDLSARFDAEGSLSALFPELYHRSIEAAASRAEANRAAASEEAGRVATAKARMERIGRARDEERRAEERSAEEKTALELVQRLAARRAP